MASLLPSNAMSSRFVQLPFDVHHQIATKLDVRSFDNLARTCESTATSLGPARPISSATRAQADPRSRRRLPIGFATGISILSLYYSICE
ncbi:uncharacterized protein PV07_10523 [Cladophialophora immunda]|uniref:F-box domain-containing protein n=1 Tax=Cladophialophora immunda TaxID=569365 RepID=A0A0D2C0I2_9EURO|nr:uncharacterized protein PV07_10523 [Cladophialophora immunda]KIW24833.1 hypothetical protein PV07_10523 [Cladophialophora immunda]